MELSNVKEFAEDPDNPFTEQGVRHLIFDSEERVAADGSVIPGNGFAEAFPKIG